MRIRYWFRACLKRQLLTPAFPILMGLILLFALAMRLVYTGQEGIVRVALLRPDETNTAATAVCDRLIQSSNATICFEYCDGEEELREKVAQGYALTGYLFPDDLEERLTGTGILRSDLVTAVRSETEETAQILDEIVFGQLYEEMGERLAVQYADTVLEPDEKRESFIRERYRQYAGAEKPFRFEQPDGSLHPLLEGEDGEREKQATGNPILGLIGLLIVLASMAGSAVWYADRKRGVFRRLTGVQAGSVHAVYVIIPVIFAGITGLVSVYLLGINGSFFEEVSRLLLLLLFTFAGTFSVQIIVRSYRVYIGLIPVCLLVNLIGGGVFTELDSIAGISVLKAVVPLSYYMG